MAMISAVVGLVASLATAEPSQIAPECPPDPRLGDMPGLLYSFDDFTPDSYRRAITLLSDMLPEWVMAAHQSHDSKVDIWGGDLGMGHYNAVNVVQGYVLKLEYLNAATSDRLAKANEFCEFLRRVSIVD